MSFQRLSDLSLQGKRVLIRQDLNVPLRDGVVTSDARIRASIPCIEQARQAGAKVMLMSHLGRPVEGQTDESASLRPVAERLSELLGFDVPLVKDYLENAPVLEQGQVVLLENVRFNTGEKANDEELAKAYAALCDVFVMDAFGTAHRAQASTYGVGLYTNEKCAGPLLSAELDALAKVLHKPESPFVALVGGAKVSTKLTVLESLLDVVDQLIPGGGIANTFLAATGTQVGKSLYEPELIGVAENLLNKAGRLGKSIALPVDVVVGNEFSENAVATVKSITEISEQDMILDIGPKTSASFSELMEGASSIIWNGPVGVFEFPQFADGTSTVGRAIADSKAFSIAGGGDTLAAIDAFGLSEQISYISTGGGAFLEYLEGKTLPAVELLNG